MSDLRKVTIDFSRGVLGNTKISSQMIDEKGADIFPSFLGEDQLAVTIVLDNSCDLKCSYCSPIWSSKWERDLELWNLRDNSSLDVLVKDVDPRFIELFWTWMKQEGNQRVCEWEISGGEPLINPKLQTFVNQLAESSKSSASQRTRLKIISNLNAPARILDKLIGEILPVATEIFETEIWASLEGIGRRIEYSRFGLSWERFEENASRLSKLNAKNFSFGFQVTLNALSVSGLSDLLKYAKLLQDQSKGNVLLNLNLVTESAIHHPQILTPEFKDYFQDALFFLEQVKDKMKTDSWSQFYEKLKMILQSFNLEAQGFNPERMMFYRFFSEYDRKRGCNFLQTYPEYTHFYQVCEKA